LTRVTDPDSVLAMSYDQANRLLSVKTDGSPNQPAVTLGYAYDPNGNRLTLTDPVQITSYSYDAVNRLQSLTQPHAPATPLPTLLAAWPGDVSAVDPVGGQHGTLQLGTAFDLGVRHQAFAFDGVDDYVLIPDSAVLDSLSTTATVDAWIKPEVPVGAEGWIFSRRDPFHPASTHRDQHARSTRRGRRASMSTTLSATERVSRTDSLRRAELRLRSAGSADGASHPLLLDPQVFAYDAVGNRTTNGSVGQCGQSTHGR
jgi:hypothetical protein